MTEKGPRKKEFHVAGIIFTGGLLPHKEVIRIIKKATIPVLLSQEDTYTVATRVHDRIIKIRPEDTEKIEMVTGMLGEHVDIPAILKAL